MLSDALKLIEKKQVMVSMDKGVGEKQAKAYLNHLRDALVAYHKEPKSDHISGIEPASSNVHPVPSINLKIEGFVGDEKKLGEELGTVIREALKDPDFRVGQWVIADWLSEPFHLRKIVKVESKYLTFDSGHTAHISGSVRLATPWEMFKHGALVDCLCQNGTLIRGRVRLFHRITSGGFEIVFEDLSPRDVEYNIFTLIEPAPEEEE